jgi:protein-tyrosine-phosphatase
VVFVCEHGSVKSLVAALHFQRLAQQRGLSVRAVSRGTQPDDAVPAAVTRALAADGFDAAGFRPQAVRAEELRAAWRTVALGVDLAALAEGARVTRWDDIPPVSVDYAAARTALLARLEALLAEFERDHARAR